jgi:Holliday junction DNA helicase RuvB
MANDAERISDPEMRPDDRMDQSIRPSSLKELIGQDQVKANLEILIAAAGSAMSAGSCAFLRSSGLGKTTLAYLLANEMSVNIKITSGPAIERTGDLAAILTNLRAGYSLY